MGNVQNGKVDYHVAYYDFQLSPHLKPQTPSVTEVVSLKAQTQFQVYLHL